MQFKSDFLSICLIMKWFICPLTHNIFICEQFSAGGDFTPQGHLTMSVDVFYRYDWDGGCYWYLVGRGQGCC